jgi:hypothetical protein
MNEIMYHPISENNLEEYIELFNAGTNTVNLAGWRFVTGVRFTFPEVTIAPGPSSSSPRTKPHLRTSIRRLKIM